MYTFNFYLRKMNSSQKDLCVNNLHKELQTVIQEDKKYWMRNDAKIRACVTSKNYEEFRDIVNAAHLSPLSKADMKKYEPKWNSVAGNKKEN